MRALRQAFLSPAKELEATAGPSSSPTPDFIKHDDFGYVTVISPIQEPHLNASSLKDVNIPMSEAPQQESYQVPPHHQAPPNFNLFSTLSADFTQDSSTSSTTQTGSTTRPLQELHMQRYINYSIQAISIANFIHALMQDNQALFLNNSCLS
jgi:hypothetical protein